jgi:hypothetical protein
VSSIATLKKFTPNLGSPRDRTCQAATHAVRLISTYEKWNVEAEEKLAERKLSGEVGRWI